MNRDSETIKMDAVISAGRLINDIDLNDLANAYKRKVLDIITKLQNGIVIFDFDGTLTEFKYCEETLLPCKEEDLEEYSTFGNIYENVYVLRTMQYILNELNPENVYIITNSYSTIIDKKNAVIDFEYPMVLKEHIYHTHSAQEKCDIVKMLHDKTGKKVWFIEDMAPTLQMAEELYTFVEGIHISSLIP